MTSPHVVIRTSRLPRPVGYNHGILAESGRTLHIAGQVGVDRDGVVVAGGVVAQFDAAAANVAAVLEAADAAPEHLVSMQIFVTDVVAYREASQQIGEAYRRHFGGHYPAVSLVEVTGLFRPELLVEIASIAVIPVDRAGR